MRPRPGLVRSASHPAAAGVECAGAEAAYGSLGSSEVSGEHGDSAALWAGLSSLGAGPSHGAAFQMTAQGQGRAPAPARSGARTRA